MIRSVLSAAGLLISGMSHGGALYHQRWDERLNLLGSVGRDEISEFGHVQIAVDQSGFPGTTIDEDFRDWLQAQEPGGTHDRRRPDLAVRGRPGIERDAGVD